jgi:hypothetical protein
VKASCVDAKTFSHQNQNQAQHRGSSDSPRYVAFIALVVDLLDPLWYRSHVSAFSLDLDAFFKDFVTYFGGQKQILDFCLHLSFTSSKIFENRSTRKNVKSK